MKRNKSRIVAAVSVILAALASRPSARTFAEPIPKASSPARLDKASQARLIQDYGKLPLSFEVNQGQADSQVKFISRGPGYSLSLTSGGAVLSLRRPEPASEPGAGFFDPARSPIPLFEPAGLELFSLFQATLHDEAQAGSGLSADVLRLELTGANPSARLSGLDELPGKSNYFIGNDPKQWLTNVPNYAKVKYQDVYPGVDLVYYGNQRQLEFDWVVSPGADPKTIRFAIEGADKLALDAQGDLLIETGGGELRFHKPVVYQAGDGSALPRAARGRPDQDGKRHFIDGRYVLRAGNQVSFELGAYDPSQPLIIDPVLVYSTYLGGSQFDLGFRIAVDSSGSAYITGATNSVNFPAIPGAYRAMLAPGTGMCSFKNKVFTCPDAFVTKLNTSGSLVTGGNPAVAYSTYLGGSRGDLGTGIAVDSSGNAYVTGFTSSSDFPTTAGAYQAARPGQGDAFVTKLNPTGSALVYSTFLGGSKDDIAWASPWTVPETPLSPARHLRRTSPRPARRSRLPTATPPAPLLLPAAASFATTPS